MDEELCRFIDDLFETMHAAKGVGLAANQVGVARRVAVVEAEEHRFAMINPVILESSGRDTAEEGCLSIPEIFGDVTRPGQVLLEAIGQDGQPFRLEAGGLVARAIQHEIDHLDGILFLDHLSPMRRRLLINRFKREHEGEGLHPRGQADAGRRGVMRIVFFGTPEFAVPSLRALLEEGFDVVGVVTQPDRPQGRSRSQVVASPVKEVAEAEGLPVLQPDRPVGDVFVAGAGAPQRRHRRRGRLWPRPQARNPGHSPPRDDQRPRLDAAPAPGRRPGAVGDPQRRRDHRHLDHADGGRASTAARCCTRSKPRSPPTKRAAS